MIPRAPRDEDVRENMPRFSKGRVAERVDPLGANPGIVINPLSWKSTSYA